MKHVSYARGALFPITLAVACLATTPALADDTIKRPGDHPDYSVEIEPHAVFGWDGVYNSNGYGIGSRFAIPIVRNGFVPSINNSVAIGFGLDFLHYGTGCKYLGRYLCDANYLFFPVVMQWNFYVHKSWSVFGEPGLVFFHGFVDSCPAGSPFCTSPSVDGVRPAIWAGGRFHFSEKAALTMRVGYPSFSVGVSFLL